MSDEIRKYRRLHELRFQVSTPLYEQLQSASDELAIPVRDIAEVALSVGLRLVRAAFASASLAAVQAGSEAPRDLGSC